MALIPVAIYYDRIWDESNNYANFDVAGLLIPPTCKYDDLHGLICIRLLWDPYSISTSIKFQIKPDIPPLSVSDESGFRFFLEVSKNSNEQFKFPLVVDKLEINESLGDNTVFRSEMEVVKGSYCTHRELCVAPLETPTYPIGFAYFEQTAIQIMDKEEERQKYITFSEEEIDDIISEPNKYLVNVHQTFKDKLIITQALRLHSISLNRQHKVERSSSRDFVLVCVDSNNCNWRLRASKYKKTNYFKVRYFVDIHTCSADILMGDHRQACSAMVSECIMNKLTNTKRKYTATDIVDDIKTDYNVSISYQKAWRSKEKALIKVRGGPHDYSLIPSWLHMLEQTNPGTVTSLELKKDGRFKYLFFAIGASIEAWKHCFPIIVIDGTFIQSTYGGTILVASSQDANRNIVPLAFAVVDSENELSWRWFFINLRMACGIREGKCIVSDRHEAIIQGLNNVFPDIMHGSCTYHVLKNIKNRFRKKGADVKKAYNGACRAYTSEDFNRHMDELDLIDPRIRKYMVEEVLLEKCTRLYGNVSRYSTMTSNTAESINNAIKGIKELPILGMIEAIRCLVQKWYFKDQQSALSTFTVLSTTAEKKLLRKINGSKNLKVESSNVLIFIVYDIARQYIVDMDRRSCTCNKFQYLEMPCAHAAAVIGKRNLSCYDYCSSLYTKTTLVATYSSSIMPLGDKDNWSVPADIKNIFVLPPNTRRPAGRPKKGRFKHVFELKTQVKCGRCQERATTGGHVGIQFLTVEKIWDRFEKVLASVCNKSLQLVAVVWQLFQRYLVTYILHLNTTTGVFGYY